MGNFEDNYNTIIDAIENKLKDDSRMHELPERFSIYRGSPTEEPRGYPCLWIAEGRIRDTRWDSGSVEMTIEFDLEYYVKSRNREQGVREIRIRTLKLFETLVGTISDRRLEVDGVALANGDTGVRVVDADFGHFAPVEKGIIYRGLVKVEIDVVVPLV